MEIMENERMETENDDLPDNLPEIWNSYQNRGRPSSTSQHSTSQVNLNAQILLHPNNLQPGYDVNKKLLDLTSEYALDNLPGLGVPLTRINRASEGPLIQVYIQYLNAAKEAWAGDNLELSLSSRYYSFLCAFSRIIDITTLQTMHQSPYPLWLELSASKKMTGITKFRTSQE
jgi:hypothetical protein